MKYPADKALGEKMPERTDLEKLVRKLVAINNIRTPLSSLYQKEKKIEGEYARGIYNLLMQAGHKADLGNSVIAYIEDEDKNKARGMEEGIKEFSKKYPKYGKILKNIVKKKRKISEIHLRYDLKEGHTLADSEYVSVMRDLELTDQEATKIYPEFMSISERLRKKNKKEPRSILVG